MSASTSPSRPSSPIPCRKASTVYTGEHRTPLRERVRLMRLGVAEGTQERQQQSDGRVDTSSPVPSPASSLRSFHSFEDPRTPPRLSPDSVPECPGAPRRGRVFDLRRLSSVTDDDGDLPDLWENGRGVAGGKKLTIDIAHALARERRASGSITPERRSPLRVGVWYSDDVFSEMDRLQEALERLEKEQEQTELEVESAQGEDSGESMDELISMVDDAQSEWAAESIGDVEMPDFI